MTDETERKLDAQKIQPPSDATKQDSVISGQPNQEVHDKAFAATHKDDKYPSEIMPALYESFGIEGDLTAFDKGKKQEGPKERSQIISIDPNPSFIEGLKAIRSDEQAQGAFSIEYIERKAREALAVVQKSENPNEQTLAASSTTPSAPIPETTQQPDDVCSDFNTPSTEKLALRDDYLNRSELNKLVPKDGDNLPLKQVLEDYKTPFMDAYERSKTLKDGVPGKSKTLEDIVDRLRDCPWADKIHIKFDSRADNTEYDNLHSTITIRPQDTREKQIENFAHEGFHATHQFLSKLYDHGIVSKKDFVNIFLAGEVRSMLTEIKVHQELNHKEGGPPAFGFIRTDNGEKDHILISDYVIKHGEKGLHEFLRTAQPSSPNSKPYGEHYAGFYDSYRLNFQQNKPLTEQLINRWVQSRHERSEI